MPPSANAPVYKEKVYVKALRMPKHIELNFKNDEYYMKKKAQKVKNNDLLGDNSNNHKEANKFNSTNSLENDKNLQTEKKFNSVNNSKTTNSTNSSAANNNNNNVNDFGFSFPNGIL